MAWADFSPDIAATYDIAIVGGGVSGLAAAWKLVRSGIERILLLEMEDVLGGTSRSGILGDSVFPWGAHYINIPPREADCIHEVLLDLGVIEGYDAAGKPLIASNTILRWPHERLFADGRWVEGLDPDVGASKKQREQGLRFADEMLRWALYQGRDGRRAFSLPLLYSSADPQVRRLDQISFSQYLQGQNLSSSGLDWLVDYACRDDYGSRASHISAWAGIHYYACRYYDYRLEDQYPAHTLTWSEGNGYLASKMAECLGPEMRKSQALVALLTQERAHVRLGYVDLTRGGGKHAIKAKAVVYAGKLHTAPFAIRDMPSAQVRAMQNIAYSPWLVAAIFLKERLPAEQTTWDNALRDSPSLGYVVADHQEGTGGRILIYYLPFVDDLDNARRLLLAADHAYWTEQIMADLRPAHPELDDLVDRIDLYRWGHGMMRPVPGAIWGEQAAVRREPMERIFFASCDATGLPLYEEAVFAGIWAAEQAMRRLGMDFETSLGGLNDG
jgi:monoamine oxidase